MNGLDHPAANGPRLLLADHHSEIEAACADLRASTYGDDPLELIERYRSFERAVLDHLAAEEEMILPAYSADAPDDAHAIRAQHDELRKQLYRIGIDVELHHIGADALERMVQTLRAHATQEDVGMYPWAQVHLPLKTKRELFVRIGQSLRALMRARSRRLSSVVAPSPH